MVVGLLGIQGAFQDHIVHLKKLGASILVVKDRAALEKVDRLIIPGGESTVMARFLRMFAMTGPLNDRIAGAMPVWGICAGAILLAETVDEHPGVLGILPVSVKRNAYGRQLYSREALVDIPCLNRVGFPAVFIRAPKIVLTSERVQVMARRDGDPVFVTHNHIMVTTFHPELTNDPVFHEFFLGL